MSGLLARDKRTMNSNSARKRSGLIRMPVKSNGAGSIIFPVAGIMTMKLTESNITSVEIMDIRYPGRNMAMLLPIQISLGVSGVARRDSRLPLAFS